MRGTSRNLVMVGVFGLAFACSSSSNSGAGNSAGGNSAGGDSAGGSSAGGNSASSSIEPFVSSFPATQSLGATPLMQQDQICQELFDFEEKGAFAAVKHEYGCKVVSIAAALEIVNSQGGTTDAQVQAACQSRATNCVLTPDRGDCSLGDALNPTLCTATVGDLEACVNDLAALYPAAIAAIPSCDTLTVAEVMAGAGMGELFNASENLASCMSYQDKCSGATELPTD
jgi:hypothetical protein